LKKHEAYEKAMMMQVTLLQPKVGSSDEALATNTFQLRPSGIASANCLEPSGRTSTITKSSKRSPG